MRLASLLIVGFLGCGPAPGTLSKIEKDVFAKSCVATSCHKGASAAGSLNLEGSTFARLVNGKATLDTEQLVVPGKPENSLLMKRLKAAAPYSLMPPTEPLDAERLEMIRSWIAAGAKND